MNFGIIGVAGYIAPRHLKAIRDTGNRLVAAVDPHDSVGILDQHSFSTRFFTEIERFDRHIEKLRRGPATDRLDYISICSPNYLHDAHCRLALRAGTNAICEKPLVINPWNLEPLQELENETGRHISTVLQLRLHPKLLELRSQLASSNPQQQHDVCLTYVTARSAWYDVSWKGDPEKSGGLAVNIGIHLFDLLLWLFGDAQESYVHLRDARRMAGFLNTERAQVRWFLSIEAADLPFPIEPGVRSTHRSLTIDGQGIEFTEGFSDLHTRVYEQVLAGQGFGIDVVRPSVELAYRIRTDPLMPAAGLRHPYLTR